VDLVCRTNPEIFLTTVSYPIKGTPYFERVRERARLPQAWAEATDRDYVIEGRRDRNYYRLADLWLRSEVEASRLAGSDPRRAADLQQAAREARAQLAAFA
jgi:anaerobic magnesium-protoporphyrin IX monomethyl ester cyclase